MNANEDYLFFFHKNNIKYKYNKINMKRKKEKEKEKQRKTIKKIHNVNHVQQILEIFHRKDSLV